LCFKAKFASPDAMIIPEGHPMSRFLLVLCLLAALGACHRKKTHTPAPPPTEDSSPSLALKSSEINLSDFVKGNQFSVQGRGCKKLEASLWHITASEAHTVTHYTFTKLPESLEGNLWLVAQKGDPFGRKQAKSYALGESIPAGTKSSTSADAPLFQGPYALESEHLETTSSYEAGREYVVFVRCMTKTVEKAHSFKSGDLESLKKHAAETKDELIAVTIRWE
jgi:hypothetical protein